MDRLWLEMVQVIVSIEVCRQFSGVNFVQKSMMEHRDHCHNFFKPASWSNSFEMHASHILNSCVCLICFWPFIVCPYWTHWIDDPLQFLEVSQETCAVCFLSPHFVSEIMHVYFGCYWKFNLLFFMIFPNGLLVLYRKANYFLYLSFHKQLLWLNLVLCPVV